MRSWAHRIVCVSAILAPGWCQNARYEDYLLPSPALLRGIVVDSDNHPVPGVQIYDVERDGDFLRTVDLGSDGRFELRTRAPSVVLRKDGFESRFLRVNGDEGLRLVLDATGEPRPLPMCPEKALCVSGAVFCLPKLKGFRFGKLDVGFDASRRSITSPKLVGSRAVLVHGSGPSWFGPEPRLWRVWSSLEYAEELKRARGLLVIDARGKSIKGTLWRSIGVSEEWNSGGADYPVGESVYYEDRTTAEAAVLDRVIDGLCVMPPNLDNRKNRAR